MARRFAEIEQEAVEVRSRLMIERWDAVQADIGFRLGALGQLLDKSDDSEIFRHIVVALIATLQTAFRGTIISLCSLDSIYRERAAEKIPEKISIRDALAWIGGTSASFGEIVAHFASCSSLTDYLSWLDSLLGLSMAKTLATVVSEYDQRNGKVDAVPIIADVNVLLSDVSEAFRLRHIFAHEAASGLTLSKEKCRRLFNAISELINGTNAVLWGSAYRHLPLTQREMNQHAFQEATRARQELDDALDVAVASASNGNFAAWLQDNQRSWDRNLDEFIANTYGSLQGTMWPSVSGMTKADACRARTAQIAGWNRAMRP